MPRFTRREMDVLDGWACGMTNRQIAAQLEIAVQSVAKIAVRVKRKLESETQAQAIVHAIHSGILQTEDYVDG